MAKFASAGAVLGYGASGGIIDSTGNLGSSIKNLGRNIADTYREGAGMSSKEARYQRQKEDFIKENGKKLENQYKADGLTDEQIKDNIDYAAQLNNYTFDEKTIEKTIQLRDQYIGSGMDKKMAEKRAAAVAKGRGDYGIKNKTDGLKNRELIMGDLKSKGFSEKDAAKILNDMMNF